ncbi:HypC/HybG/HupF family hydrogenase formation chaperone [Candidatus Latescibacterota bacterium]
MCLAVPLKLMEVNRKTASGIVDISSDRLTVGLDLVPEAKSGDYVLVHAGMAIELLDEVEAEKIIDIYENYVYADDLIIPEQEGKC